jgi:1-acyl-sn-glycerol-3-phosphate acyltransferase
MAGGLLACLPLHFLWLAAGRRSPWPRLFLAWVGRSAGMRVRIEGTPLKGRVLFLANHQSWLDIMLIAGTSGAAFVSKDDVARWPLVGWLARLNHTVFVERSQRSAVRGQADSLRKALAGGQPVALFPEGTTEGGAAVLPFRASLLAALYPPVRGLLVQPVAIDYGPAASRIAWVGKEAALANARRVFSHQGSTPVTVRFLAPLDPGAFADRKLLARAAHAAVAKALNASGGGSDGL